MVTNDLGWHKDILKIYDSVVDEAKQLIDSLEEIDDITAENIHESVKPKII